MKSIIKSLLQKTPYKVVRRSRENRFSAIDQSLISLRQRGFDPPLILDGGANVGEFSRLAFRLFPRSTIHAVEPQPGCAEALQSLQTKYGDRLVIHMAALCAPEDHGSTLTLFSDSTYTSTGAHVALGDTTGSTTITVPCLSIDNIISDTSHSFGSLLKLDLQGYEMHALHGAVSSIKTFDVMLIEVSFFAQVYEPPISALVKFLAENGFELYDIASLSARRRDDRPHQADFVFVRSESALAADRAWS